MEINHVPRLERLRERLRELNADALHVHAAPNIRYLTGYSGEAGELLVTPERAVLFTDGRFALQAETETTGVEVVLAQRGRRPLTVLVEWLAAVRIRRLAFESERLSHAGSQALALPRRRLIPTEGLVEELRLVKDEGEIERLRRSCALNSQAFEAAAARLRPLWTESRLAAEIERELRRLGADAFAFDTIVASGAHGALPHARPRPRRLEPRTLVTVDHGGILDGYASDMTRMLALGAPDPQRKRLFEAVLEAQAAALDAVRSGVQAEAIDRRARSVLRKHQLVDRFLHSTGHGVGLEIHEGPRLGPRVDLQLREGMVVTIEPGVYHPALGGARVEDLVVVRRGGCEILTLPDKDLRVL